MKKKLVYSAIALGAIPVVANAVEVQKQAATFKKAVWEEAGATVNDAGLILSSPEGTEIKYAIGTLQKGNYVFTGKLKTKLYKVTVKIGGKTQEIEPDPDNEKDVNIEFDLSAATNVELTLTSAGNGVTGSEFTLGSPVLNLKFDFEGAKTTLTNALNDLETIDMAAYPYDSKADKDAMPAIQAKIDAIAETYDVYAAQKLYDLPNSPIMGDIKALKETIASKQNVQAFNDVNILLNDIKAKFGVAKTNIEAELTGAAAYLMTPATKDLNAINDVITNLIQANTTAKNTGKAVAEKTGIVDQIPTEDAINALVTKYTGDTGLDTQAKKNKDAYKALSDKVTTLQTNLDNVKYEDESLTSSFVEERGKAQKAINDIKAVVDGVYNKADQLTKNIDGDVTTAQGKIDALAGKVNTANTEFTANANAVKDIAALQGKLDAAKSAVDAKESADGKYKAKDFYAKYVEDVQKEITKLSDDAKAAYKVDGTGTAETYYTGLAAKITPIETEISDYKTNAIAAVEHYNALQEAMSSYQTKLDAARAIYSGKEYYNVEGANYDFKFAFDKLQKDINDIQAAIDAATAKKDGAAQVVGSAHWTAMNAIDARPLFTETYTSVAELDGKSFTIVNAADGKAFFGSTAQNLGYDIFDKSYVPTNTGYVFKLEATGTTDQYLLQLYKPNGEKYNCWGMGGWLNTQPADGSCCFILGLNSQNGQDLENGAVWEVKFVADKGFTLKNIGTGKYLKDTAPAKYDDPTFFTFKAVDGNSIEAKIFALENRETNADNNWAADGLTGGSVKDLEGRIDAFREKYTEAAMGTNVFNALKSIEDGIEGQLSTIKGNIAGADKNKPETAAEIAEYGKNVTALIAQQDALEADATIIFDEVFANTTLQGDLKGKVTTLDGKITTFKTTYGMNSPEDASILGESFDDVKTVEGNIKKDLDGASGAINAVVPTNVEIIDKTDKVGTDQGSWVGAGGLAGTWAAPEVNGKQMVETYNAGSCTQTGTMLSQTITGLDNGIYKVVLCANAMAANNVDNDHAIQSDATDVAYVFANDVKQWITAKKANTTSENGEYVLNKVIVKDGTLSLGLEKVKGGTNWHTIQIKSLSCLVTSANATALAAQKVALDGNGADVKGLIARQSTLETQANAIKEAVAAIKTLSYDGLKNLEGVTDASGNYDNTAAKKSLTLGTGAEDYFIFKTGLAADKTFEARVNKVKTDENNMKQTIKTTYNAGNGDFAGIWNKDTKSFGNYKVSDLQAAINLIKTDAVKELENWNAYNTTVTPFVGDVTTAIDDALNKDTDSDGTTDLEEKAGTNGKTGADFDTALTYYQGVLNGYTTDKNNILTAMKTSLYERKAVAMKGDDNSGYVKQLKELKTKAEAVLAAADANFKKYTEQKTGGENGYGYQNTQSFWNEVYTTIAGEDQTTKRQYWLDSLDVIQLTLTAATNAVEQNYLAGKAVDQAKDFAAIYASIKAVKDSQEESYNAFVEADNKAAHETFMGTESTKGKIQLATEAYQKAFEERGTYSSTNEEIKTVVDNAAADLDAALYGIPKRIQDLTVEENTDYTNTVSPKLFDVSSYNTKATQIKTNVEDALNAFKIAVKGALQTYWTNKTSGYNTLVTNAEADIAGYDADAKKDAFKDVKKLIAQGDAGIENLTLSEIEGAIAGLENINNMLTADKNAAAKKDINTLLTAAKTKYSQVLEYISGVTVGKAYTSDQADNLQALEDAYDNEDETIKDVAYVKSMYDKNKVKFSNHNGLANILNTFITTAETCRSNVKTLVDNDGENNTAYEDVVTAIKPVADKFDEAEGKANSYKYQIDPLTDENPFELPEGTLSALNDDTEDAKDKGQAVAKKATLLGQVTTLDAQIDNSLKRAFEIEKDGLAADIKELKNQYNTYVVANGVDAASAYKTAIDGLETQLNAIAIVDADDPADGYQYDEILAATNSLIGLQKAIADKETELLAANANTANANALADFNTKIGDLEKAASLEGKAAWVGSQPVDDTDVNSPTILDAINEIQGQITTVKAEIEKDKENISFFKDKYQGKIDAINAALNPVTAAIATNQAKYEANVNKYTELTGDIKTLQDKVDAAKEKVGDYKYNGVKYNYFFYIEHYDNLEVLDNGIQKTINDATAAIEIANGSVSLTSTSKLTDFGLNVTDAEQDLQKYLDKSAYKELNAQVSDLQDALNAALKYQSQKYSPALWRELVAKESDIQNLINDLNEAVAYSYNTTEWDDELNSFKPKDCTSDKDYAEQMQTVATIAQEITDLANAMDNLSLLGDANQDNKVNVLDYQKVLNMILDPTLQPAEGSDQFFNTDVNENEVIEVGDLTSIVNYILYQNWNGHAAAPAARGEKMEGESLSMTQGTNRIAINLANVTDYTAFQMDLVLPEGMKLVGAELSNRASESHKLYSRAQQDGSIRMVASSVKGETFSGNEGAVLYIDVEGTGTPELLNILFSDANAVTRSFAIGNDATGIDTVSTFESLKQKVYDLGGRMKNSLKKGINIIRRADGSTGKVVK